MTKHDYFNPEEHRDNLANILLEIDRLGHIDENTFSRILKKYTKAGGDYYSKTEIITGFEYLRDELKLQTPLKQFREKLQRKPVRTESGVTPVTVLTKPFPCPGKCIFCPSDIRMPKSYLADEPGAQRAANNAFDPYLQTYSRLQTYKKNGHPTDKIEIIVLGGTWSYYPEPYQIWFIKRCFDAMNDFGLGIDRSGEVQTGSNFKDSSQTIDGKNITKTYNQTISEELVKRHGKPINSWENASWEELETAQKINESGAVRCIGMVIETRPDNISPEEVLRIRRLGCTKTQIGFQSLNDHVLTVNKRGHDVAATRRAMALLRLAGFKIHAHWMPNLYGSSPEADKKDFEKMFSDPDFMPDELKIYPCSLISSAELMSYYQKDLWQPYSETELLDVLTYCMSHTPEYCRLTRVIRDIPGTDIVVGNKKTNFRQIAEAKLTETNSTSVDIRAREIRSNSFDPETISLKDTLYQTSVSTEHFLQFVTTDNQILGFLRLSLPLNHFGVKQSEAIEPMNHDNSTIRQFNNELLNSALIREVHVYGPAVKVGESGDGKTQHLGLGKKMIQRAIEIAAKNKFKDLAVISGIGTREYYRKLGFTDGALYQHYQLTG